MSLSYVSEAKSPSALPDLRLWLLDQWAERGSYTEIGEFGSVFGHHIYGTTPQWERLQLARASLWFIDEEMVDLLLAVEPTIPGEVHPTELLLPDIAGFVVLAKPWFGKSADTPEIPVRVDAFVWGRTTLPPGPGDDPDGVDALSLSSYQWCPLDDGGVGIYAPIGRSDWPIGDALTAAPYWAEGSLKLESFFEDRRVMAALFTMLGQQGLTTVEQHRPPRAAVRRAQRAGISDPSTVKLVVLRRPPGEPASAPENGQERHYSHRWPVRPHTVLQPYGPRSSLRKLIMRGPYIKGPKDAPLVLKDEVFVWKR